MERETEEVLTAVVWILPSNNTALILSYLSLND